MLAELIPKVAGQFAQKRGEYSPRPSSAGPERCIRQMVYHGMGTPEDKPIGDRFVLVLDDSSWHEELTADWIEKTGYQIHSRQMPVDIDVTRFDPNAAVWLPTRNCATCGRPVPTGCLHGHIDGIVTDILKYDRHYEHKALNMFGFQRYATGEQFPLDYITQCCIYILGDQAVNPAINQAVLLVKNKNTAAYLEMVIHYDFETDTAAIYEIVMSSGTIVKKEDNSALFAMHDVVGDAVRKLAEVNQRIQSKTLPARPYDHGTDFPCNYCSWNETCWQGYFNEVKAISDHEADLNELADTARYYNELGGQISEMTSERENIGKAIKAKLNELGARKGKAGEFLIDWQIRQETRVKKKEDIDPTLLPQVTATQTREVLYVKIPKVKAISKPKAKVRNVA